MLFDATIGGRVVRVEVSGRDGRYAVSLDGRRGEVDWHEGGRLVSLLMDGRSFEVGLVPTASGYTVVLAEGAVEVELAEAGNLPAAAPRRVAAGPVRMSAPMPGKIVRLLVGGGEEVAAGQGLVVMEAMKMENEIRSPRGGRVRELGVREGQAVETGTLLLVLE